MAMALSRMATKLQCSSRAASVSGPSGQPRKALSRCAVPRRSCGGGDGQPGAAGRDGDRDGDVLGLTWCSSS